MDFLERCTCGVCMDLFADPRMLSCGHTYCQKCIEPLLRGGQFTKKASCPECRRESTQPANGFPVNFCVRGMVSDIQASANVRGVGSCEECQKKILLPELFCCSTCTLLLGETSRFCGWCIAKSHKGHDYKELDLASKQDIDKALRKIESEHVDCIFNKQNLLVMKGAIASSVLRLAKRLDERMASMDALATDISNGTALTKDQLSDKVQQVEQCGLKGDVAAARTALRECSRNLLQIPVIQQASSGPVPGDAARSAVEFPGAASAYAHPRWHRDI